MQNGKYILLSIGIALGFLSNLARLGTFGFFYPIGLISILVFGSIHIKFLIEVSKHFEILKLSHKIVVWIGVLTYPMIFLFQFDLEEFKDAFYIYEFLTGTQTSAFENYAYYIALVSGIVYLLNFIVWRLKLKNLLGKNVQKSCTNFKRN